MNLSVGCWDRANPCIVIAEAHPLYRTALAETLGSKFGHERILQASSLEETIDLLERDSSIELVMLDLQIPDEGGFDGLMTIRTQFPSTPLAIVSGSDEPREVRRASFFGACGYLPKSLGADAIRSVTAGLLRGDVWFPPDVNLDPALQAEENALAPRFLSLTPQQSKVLSLMHRGLTNKQIAETLSIRVATAKTHISNIYLKIGVSSRTMAVRLANEFRRATRYAAQTVRGSKSK